jgi:phosphoribosylformylglycinamidine cyclo-ligase
VAQNSNAPSGSITYADAGVDIDRSNKTKKRIKYLAHKTFTKGVLSEIGGFGGLFSIDKKYVDPVLVSSVDGVGTKLKVAFEMKMHHTVGGDLVNHCVNDIAVQGAAPLFFMDYLATGALDPEVAEKIVAGLAEACKHNGCALIGGETAEMPGIYAGKDYDLAGFSVGAVERDRILPRADVAAGDVVLGLPSSGLHSNGFSLVRRIVADTGLALTAPAPFAPGTTLAAALLTPTRIYVRPLLSALAMSDAIKALAHITGGGFPDNLPRVLPDSLGVELDLAAFAPQPLFSWLAGVGCVGEAEMLRTFNCGFGMVAFAAAASESETIRELERQNLAPTPIGRLAARGAERVAMRGRLNL